MNPVREYIAYGFKSTRDFLKRGNVSVDYGLYLLRPVSVSAYDDTDIIEGELVTVLDDTSYQRGHIRSLSPGLPNEELAESFEPFEHKDNAIRNFVNINTATIGELSDLPGVGEQIAKNIVDYRNKHGRFRNIYGILSVPGIAMKRFQAILDLITVDDIAR